MNFPEPGREKFPSLTPKVTRPVQGATQGNSRHSAWRTRIEENPAMNPPLSGDGQRAWRDVALIALCTLLFAMASVHFDFGETLSAWTQPREKYQLDELPGVLLVIASGMAWFALRRTRDARMELARRRAAEGELVAALSEIQRLERANSKISEEERRHLARELHDELGQYLNAIKLDAIDLRDHHSAASADAQRRSTSIIAIVDRLQATVGDMVRRLRPPGLDELGLAAAIEDCIDGWRRRLPAVHFDLHVTDESADLGESRNMALFRVIQEALTNIAKHAQARHVAIRLDSGVPGSPVHGPIVLQVNDDGVGVPAVAPRTGAGLVGMRERIETLGGVFEARNDVPRGFRIRATLPSAAPIG
jgi:signal transduction histidine kinase